MSSSPQSIEIIERPKPEIPSGHSPRPDALEHPQSSQRLDGMQQSNAAEQKKPNRLVGFKRPRGRPRKNPLPEPEDVGRSHETKMTRKASESQQSQVTGKLPHVPRLSGRDGIPRPKQAKDSN